MKERIRSYYLTREPHTDAAFIAFLSVMALFLASVVYWANLFHAGFWMTAGPQHVFSEHQYWRLWSALFAHVDLEHLLSNSILFFAFGFALNGYFGFWAFPFWPLVFGGLINWIALHTLPENASLLGVSGVVYWMGSAWMTLYFCLDVRTPTFRRLIKAVGISLILFVPETFHPAISYLSHALGFAFGIFWAFGFYLVNRRRFLSFIVTEPPEEEGEIQDHVVNAF